MARYLTSTTILRYYSSAAKQAQDRYVARLVPKRILKASEQTPNFESEGHVEEINEAVKQYLSDYNKNTQLFAALDKEYELGKRHLANIMGYDPNNITQEQIDKAIKYLFPSGLFETNALPVMKPPAEIFPKFKTALYDKRGRPFSSFFYTKKPNFYESLYELYNCYEELNRVEDEKIALGLVPTADDKLNALKYVILDKKALEAQFLEELKDHDYERFKNHFKKLMEHPYSALKEEFISRFAEFKQAQQVDEELFELKIDEVGREYSQSVGFHKTVESTVKVYNKGTGKFVINDKYNLNFFDYYTYREKIMSPLVMSDMIDKVDIYCYFEPIDKPLDLNFRSAYSGSIRFNLAKALCAFIDDEKRELLRVNGLLQHDRRHRERKKPGKLRARKSRPYRKR